MDKGRPHPAWKSRSSPPGTAPGASPRTSFRQLAHLAALLALPIADTLWLARATPRAWLADGQTISVSGVPTRWGRLGFAITSHLSVRRVDAVIDLPSTPFAANLNLRLRVPEGHRLVAVTLNCETWTDFDPSHETINLPAGRSGRVAVVATYSGD